MPNNVGTLLMIVLFIALGYFMLVRPARVQQRKHAEMMKDLEPGARVMTQIGVYGTLLELGDVQARIEVAPDVVITIDKRLLTGVVPRSRDEFWDYPDEPAELGQESTDDTVEGEGTVEGEIAREPADRTDEAPADQERAELDEPQPDEPRPDEPRPDEPQDGPSERKA